MDKNKVMESLQKKGYEVSWFETKEEATAYLAETLVDSTIGFGDSLTFTQMGLYDALSKKNTVHDPNQWHGDEFLEVAKKAYDTDYFLTSVNGISEDGVIINIDGTGNRVGSSLFGHKKVFYVLGVNKFAEDTEKAIWRARNIAAPLNAQRIKYKTPCAVKGDHCYDCKSPDRICNALLVQFRKMTDTPTEIVIINENLGY